MSDSGFDLIVIGAGPGGYIAASRAAELGLSVACVEKAALGGTCLNVGCIPSKALLESSELYHRAAHGLEHHGIGLGQVQLDLAPMMQRKEKIVGAMVKGIGSLFKGHGVEAVQGTARLAGPDTVVVSGAGQEERQLQARHILIATGSAPIQLADLPFDGEHIVSSTEALSLDTVPRRLVVVGGGAIGLELGSVWQRLGSEVVVVEYMDQIVPGMDAEMAGQLQRLLKRQGLTIQLEAAARSARVTDAGVELVVARGEAEETLQCDRVLVAVGRRAYTDGLGLEELGVEMDDRGRVAVDAHFRTSVDSVYAIGDVIAGPMLAHKAEEEGRAVAELLAGKAGHVNYQTVPGVVYTHPELASVGLSEAAAREQHGEVTVGKHQFRANARAHCMDAIDGLVKIVADSSTDRLLGVHILGAQASHLIAEAVVAMEFGASAEDLARTVHAHPALSEVVRDAARAASG